MKCFGFSTALLSGILLGILIAPEKGSETRKKLAGQAEGLKRKIDNLLGRENESLTEIRAILENETAEITREVRRKLLQLVNDTKKSYHFDDSASAN
jgi:gas vesicle protein